LVKPSLIGRSVCTRLRNRTASLKALFRLA
jgi:hypothetical protein